MPVVVQDIISEIQQVTGKCSQSYLFQVLTRAVETLARKSCTTSITWDPLVTYLDLPVQNDYYVFLPPQIEKPIKININSNPSFSHSQLYEFTMNGPGSNDLEAGWQWQDRGTGAIQRRFPRQNLYLYASSDSESDVALSLHIKVRQRDRSEIYIDLPITPLNATPIPSSVPVTDVLDVVKPITVGTIQLRGGHYVLAYYTPLVTLPQFMQIKLSQRATMIRMLARKRTTVISSLLDVIPLNSAQAIKMMVQAIKYYDETHFDLAQTAEAAAVTFLSEEQAARNIYSQAASATEVATALNLTIGQRDCVIVADIYDEACRIFGFLGREKIFDRITSTLELLYNKSQWDGLIGYVDIRSDDDYYAALPRYVDQILALNLNGQRGTFMNKWFEFNLNSLGEFSDQRQDPTNWTRWDQLLTTEKAGRCGPYSTYGLYGADGVLRNNRPPYGWEEVGETPLAYRLKGPSQLVAVPELAQDNNAQIMIYGYDEFDQPVLNKSGSWGTVIPCRKHNLTPARGLANYRRIERVTKEPTYGFISLYAINPFPLEPNPLIYPGASVPQMEFLSLYWPQDTEPMYKLIRVGHFCKRLRIRYRKNYLKVSSLSDPIHVRSREAVCLAMTGLAAMKQGGNASATPFMPTAGVQIGSEQINMAVDMLDDEWRVMHPHEKIQIQWDSRIYGNAFPQVL
jgi:hypothetical protein